MTTAIRNPETPEAPSLPNPMGTDGFEFVEYTAPDPAMLDRLFRSMAFEPVARHRSKNVTLYRQGGVNFIVNAEPHSFARSFAAAHGPSICAVGFRVRDAAAALRRATALGARRFKGGHGPMELNIPAIRGVGDSLIYLIDRYGDRTIYDVDFVPLAGAAGTSPDAGFLEIDHLTHNVERGHMDRWAGFYERLFGFREIRYFDIEGRMTGLRSRAMTSLCGKIRIPINESADDRSQIAEFLTAYNGEGIQHVALSTADIHATVETLRARGVPFLAPPPESYYARLEERLPGHGEDVPRMQRNGILIDGAPTPNGGRLLQIFTANVIGPIFFEVIQRKGDEGFGEGNFKALFEAMEQDQVRRGVLDPAGARQ